MSGTDGRQPADLLRAYQAQEMQFVERRFPLQYRPEEPAIRELYSQAKGLRWDPETDVAWDHFDPGIYSEDVRAGARLTWSRRAWGTYPGLGESTALLVRMCLESGALAMDSKLFLSFRPAEEAKHLEACYLVAERLGGYAPEPEDAESRTISNHPFSQAALDKRLPVEAFVAALGTLDDQLDLNLDTVRLQQSRDPVVRQVLRLITADKQRHVLFAWTFLGSRLGTLSDAQRTAVVATVADLLEHVILHGYRMTSLLPKPARELWLAAEELTAGSGLGAAPATLERRVLMTTVAQLRERLSAWGLALPTVAHGELGEV